MIPNPKEIYECNKSNLVVDHWSLKISLLSHMLSKSSLPQFIRKLTTRHTCPPSCKLCSQISRKLCYQTQEGFFFNSYKIFKLPKIFYLLLLFKVPQTSNPHSPFPPSTKNPHPSSPFSKKNHTRKKNPKIVFPLTFQDPSFNLFSLSHGS